jgi:hypothetical protein
VAKARKSKGAAIQHTWKVIRRNSQSVEVTAESVSVQDGDLVFATSGVVVRVICADTFLEVELVTPLVG